MTTKAVKIIRLAKLTSLKQAATKAASRNFDNPEVWAKWNTLVNKYETDIQTLKKQA
jgi:hypothetical protein